MRLNDEIASQMGYPESPMRRFDSGIQDQKGLVESAARLLKLYSTQKEEAWRAVWIAYVFSDHIAKSTKESIRADPAVSPVVQLWTSHGELLPDLKSDSSLDLFELNYLEAGRKYRG
jgi:hypothetical protein